MYGLWRFVLYGSNLLLDLRFSQNGLIYPLYQKLAGRGFEAAPDPEG
jgi:hypothetical protein